MYISNKQLQKYVCHCPSCGSILEFGEIGYQADLRCCKGTCTNKMCKNPNWSFMFQPDASGTFGVMAYQCDNEDRIM